MHEAVPARSYSSAATSVRTRFDPGALTHALWGSRTLRARLLTLFVLIELIAGAVAGVVTILKARTATSVEIAASMELAELWVNEVVLLGQRQAPAGRFLDDLASHPPLIRHVRIEVRDAGGALRQGRPATAVLAPPPAWFAALIAPPIERRVVPVMIEGKKIGTIDVVSEPNDEIGEKWEAMVVLAAAVLALSLFVIALLYVLVGRVLEPLVALARGLGELEQRRYQVRLARAGPPELAIIADHFNALAEALEATRAENHSLNRRLITAQDDERRRTALDLHDEVGPSLFGLKATAASIGSAAAALPDAAARGITSRVAELVAIIDHLQATNRGMLNRLRPMTLGQLPLKDVLAELVSERARHCPQIRFTFEAHKLDASYGDSIDLTLYRCVQESLTNAIRHAQARRVDVEIGEAIETNGAGAASLIRLTVRDDGRGIDPHAPKGLGILGMRERVECLGGTYKVGSESGRGTALYVTIPVRETANRASGMASSRLATRTVEDSLA
jgi:two-component system sensor histidine kinase UhpB